MKVQGRLIYMDTKIDGCWLFISTVYYPATLIYTNSYLPSYSAEVAKYYTTFPKYFPDGCFVVYRLLVASFSVNSKLVRPFRSFSVPFRSFSVFRPTPGVLKINRRIEYLEINNACKFSYCVRPFFTQTCFRWK